MKMFNRLQSRLKKQQQRRPKLLELRSAKWFIIFVVSFATSTDIFMYGLIVPVIPTALEQRVGLAQSNVQEWTSILLALHSASLLACSPIVGYIADRFQSRRGPLLAGLVALGAATALLCIGTHISLWIVGRLCQGAAAAVVWTVGVTLLVETVGKERLGEAIGYMSMSLSIGTLAGPLLGGVVYQHGDYFAVFGLAFGLIGLDIFFRLVLIERKRAARWHAPEMRSVMVCEQQPEESLSMGQTAIRATSGRGPGFDDSEGSIPSQPRRGRLAELMSSCRLVTSLWGYFIISLCLTSFDSVLPLFVQDTFRWQQTGQGLIFFPLMIPHLVDPITGLIIDRYPRSPRYLSAGAFLCSLPLMVLLRLVKDDSTNHKILLCSLLGLIGLCLAVAMTPIVAEVFHAVKEKEYKNPSIFGQGGATALAFGLSNMSFAAGSLIGPFFAGFIRQSAGWDTMGWALGLIVGLSAIPIILYLGGSILHYPTQIQ